MHKFKAPDMCCLYVHVKAVNWEKWDLRVKLCLNTGWPSWATTRQLPRSCRRLLTPRACKCSGARTTWISSHPRSQVRSLQGSMLLTLMPVS